jgi:hypothetical protein
MRARERPCRNGASRSSKFGAMDKQPRTNPCLAALLGREPEFKKRQPPHVFRSDNAGAVIYEDDAVFAIEQRDKETHDGSNPDVWDTRVLLAPKEHIRSLLDLDVSDGPTAIALLRGIQRVALQLGLEKRGFEISIDVMPPRQHVDLLKIKIRSGEKKAAAASMDDASGDDA